MSVSVFISEDQIKQRIKALAAQINQDFKGQELTVITVLNGSFMFSADLVREIKDIPIIMEFISASSYGSETQSSGEVKLEINFQSDLKDKNVLIVEDIVDTGLTLNKLMHILKIYKPKTVKLASLISKPANTVHFVSNIDYLGFEIEDKFVVGYGLDFAGQYRHLPYIGVYEPKK